MQRLTSVAAGVAACVLQCCEGHGLLTLPESMQNGSLAVAGSCAYDSCMWYSDFVQIPGEPTINQEHLRTFNVKVSSGPADWTRKNPWRAPGTAPVIGSGCGVMGGEYHPVINSSGNFMEGHLPAGTDGAHTPAKKTTVWRKGEAAEVAFALTANHGGGYSYRLCPKNGTISEECFQQHVLSFEGDKQWIQYGSLSILGSPLKWTSLGIEMNPRQEIRRTVVTEGTYPAGSEWARNPVPSCNMYDQSICSKFDQVKQRDDYITCAQWASGYGIVQCPPNKTQFPEPLPGLSGYVPSWYSALGPKVPQWSNVVAHQSGEFSMGFPFSIVDKVRVPSDLPDGEYLLSWRWDAEQSPQVWQNCASVELASSRAADKSGEDPDASMEAFVVLP
eukprot:TRINITY_DN61171_c0_g1_i1.p1 TRINITY_DN61171_c0_g1~~TRINITY_DN61171_c0_g1_i1.p1  ORF type:complete len:389 (+),score=53.25 TRINITY_DN61171_c0_g1_i1:78-1244(+)